MELVEIHPSKLFWKIINVSKFLTTNLKSNKINSSFSKGEKAKYFRGALTYYNKGEKLNNQTIKQPSLHITADNTLNEMNPVTPSQAR